VTQFAGGRADEAFAPFRYRTPALPGSTARFDGAHKRVADARDRSEGTGHCVGHVLVLGVAELPNLVGLEAVAGQIVHALVHVFPADRPDIRHELQHRVAGWP